MLAYETLEEDFAALIVTVGARRGAAASSSPDLAPATAITLDAASPDASGGAAGGVSGAATGGATGEPTSTSETTGGASDDKMREELERLMRMLRHEETGVQDALEQADKLWLEADKAGRCPFNLSYARGDLARRYGDVRQLHPCEIGVSDLSNASRAILTMAYATDFARLGYDPLDLGLRGDPLEPRAPPPAGAEVDAEAHRAAHRRDTASGSARRQRASAHVLLAPATASAAALPSSGTDFCEM